MPIRNQKKLVLYFVHSGDKNAEVRMLFSKIGMSKFLHLFLNLALFLSDSAKMKFPISG